MLIRAVLPTDAETIAALSTELGYPAPATTISERIAARAGLPDHAIFVACIVDECIDAFVVGWIDISVVRHLQSGTYGEICGLVVSEARRGLGVGRALVLRAEQWFREKGLAEAVVRSRVAREAAHRFYLREGYSVIKQSTVFTKTL